jgi:quercetin dioxygenase-like cupin family protein
MLSGAAKQFTVLLRMNDIAARRFVTAAEKVDFLSPWTTEEWLCRGDVVKNEQLLLVRANMEPFRSHPFHKHPTREELIYIISGRAEQWVGKTHRILGPGEMAFIPMGEIHGTYNPFHERLVFLAILSPSHAAEPGIVDVSAEEPWASLRKGFPAVM